MANKIEVLKQAKDGLDVFPDLLRYASEGPAAIEPDDFERLKWYGLFHRKATPGYLMLRLRIPNGVLTSEQIAAIGEIANRCGRGQADVTTQQNIQLRWIEIEDVPWIFQRLSAAGLTSQQSGMDNVRNVVGCPIAGLDPDELIGGRMLATRLQQAIIGHKGFSNLPRKFNLAITGCLDDCIHAQTHDLSYMGVAVLAASSLVLLVRFAPEVEVLERRRLREVLAGRASQAGALPDAVAEGAAGGS